MIKWSIHQKDIIIINKYAHNIRAHKYIKQTNRSEGSNKQYYSIHFDQWIDHPERKPMRKH